jgi:tetratricopeptide (TPR) repeat protein
MQEIQGICYYKLASATGDGKLYGNAIRVIEESKKDSPVALAALALSYRRISDAHGYKALSRKSNDIIRSMMQMLHTREYPLNPGNGWGKTTIYVVDPHNKMLDMGVKMLYCDEIVQEALDLNTVDRPPAIFFPSAICPPVAINGDAGKLLSTLRENTTDSSRRDGEYSQSLPALFMERYFPLFHHMNNLGLGYLVLSQEKDAAGNIGKAIESFNKAVALADNDLRRARIDPQSNRQGLFNVDNFAAVQNNLGVAYVMLSNYSEREKNLAAAARCFTQALQYYTEKDYPILHQSMLTSLDAVNKSLREQQSKTVTAEEDRVRQNKTGKAEKN